MVKQVLIAVDQLINTFINHGFADETISARAFRMTDVSEGWNVAHKWIDRFFKLLINQNNHCYESYLSELHRKQLPKEYTTSRLHAAFLLGKK